MRSEERCGLVVKGLTVTGGTLTSRRSNRSFTQGTSSAARQPSDGAYGNRGRRETSPQASVSGESLLPIVDTTGSRPTGTMNLIGFALVLG